MAKNLQALLTASLVNMVDLKYSLDASNKILDIQNSTGQNLDICGNFVDEFRNSDNDDQFRIRIINKIKLLTSYGNREDLILATKFLTGATSVNVQEGNGLIFLEINSPVTTEKLKQIKQYVSAGVTLLVLITFPETFGFADDPAPDTAGFGDYNDPNIGGKFAYLYTN